MGRVFLFDIDLTMIRTNRAGSVAMTETLWEMLDIEDAFAGVEFGGRTDRNLLREALLRHRPSLVGPAGERDDAFEGFIARFKERYFPRLMYELEQRGGVVLPGVPEMLDAVGALPEARLGLATGNFRGAAEIKLRYFGLWPRFAGGGFADDGEDRAELVAAAIRRMTDGAAGVHQVYIFGDSTHDVAAAKANGAVAIGVATGGSSTEILSAAGADFVFNSLSDPETVLRVVLPRDSG